MDAAKASNCTGQTTWARRLLVGRNPRFTLARCLALVVVCLVVFKFVLQPIRVQGVSMMPTYRDGRVNLVNRLAYWQHPPQRGDVVAIRSPAGEHLMYMKRIIALPGETLEFHGGHAFINGQPLDEPYLKFPCNWEHAPEHIQPGEYYVVGDNRSMAWDDHWKGRAYRQQIVGKVLL